LLALKEILEKSSIEKNLKKAQFSKEVGGDLNLQAHNNN